MEVLATFFAALLEKIYEHLAISGGELAADAVGNYLAARPILALAILIVLVVAAASFLIVMVARKRRR